MADLQDLIDDPNRDAEEDYIFNEYTIDDTLDPLHRLVRYHQSDFSLQRLVLVRELHDTVQYAGYAESVKVVVPLLSQFASDAEPGVRQTLVQQLHPLAAYFVEHGGEEGYQYLLSTFLPTSFDLLVDKNVGVGATALQTILALAELVRDEDVQAHLLNVVITLAHDERAEDYRVVAAQLFNDLACKFGEHYCVTIVLRELELLSNDSSFSVRKTVGGKLGGVCRAITSDAAARTTIVAIYVSLCQDDVWGVRQACAEAIEDVALGLPEEARVLHLLPVYQAMLEDSSRWVRNRAHEYLGHLLHCLRSEDISPKLLQLYTDMAFQSESGECEHSEYCAFCFPAVVEAIGRDRWPEVQDAYATMLKDVQWKVRKSLAYSLHELAQLLGQDITEECLVPAFELFLRDLEDVKRGAVEKVPVLLQVVRPSTLARLVPLLCHVPLESENWRLRNEVAMQMGDVAVLLPATSEAFASIVALVLRLLDDSVIEVRNSTFRPAAVILRHLAAAHATDVGDYLPTLLELVRRPSFQGRQIFIYLAQHMVDVGVDGVFEQSILPGLLTLASDPVSNVRLVLERVVTHTLLAHERWREHAMVQKIVSELRARSEDVVDGALALAATATADALANNDASMPTTSTTAAATTTSELTTATLTGNNHDERMDAALPASTTPPSAPQKQQQQEQQHEVTESVRA